MRLLPSLLALAGAVSATLLACDSTDPDSYKFPVTDDTSCDADLATPEGYVKALKCNAYQSCAFTCTGCGEVSAPYACPAMRTWPAIAHADACGAFDGKTMPAPIAGKCNATAPTGGGKAPAGQDANVAKRIRLPDAHFIEPAGHEQLLAPKDVTSGFPLDVVLVPGTRFAVVSDSGVDDDAIEVVDLDLLAADKPALVSSIAFPSPAQLYYGLAFALPNRVFASGAADGVLYAFTLDTTSGALTRDAKSDVALGAGADGTYFAGGIATSADGSALVVAPSSTDTSLRVANVGGGAVTSIDLGASETFDVVRDPSDTSGATYWVSSMDARALLRVDLAQRKVLARLPTGKNPEGVALLDATHVAVASSDDDTVAVFDTTTAKLVQTLALPAAANGVQPGALAYDAVRKRLYATLSGINAIGVYAVDTTAASPLSELGRIPTAWWPTAVRVRDDGTLVVLTGKGHGTGAGNAHYDPGKGVTPELTRGSIAVVDPAALDLSVASATVAASRKTGEAEGFPTVKCDSSATYDFPIPLTNAGAPSAQIEHVVFVVRENKTFDAVFGDFEKVNGAPPLVMSPGKMDEYWRNVRAIAKSFALSDNFYVDAEQSLQGHVWTTFGRSSDFIERTWTSAWGRLGATHARKPKAGIDKNVGYPSTGSLFQWLERAKIPYDDMGEIVGLGEQGWDPSYPGTVYTVGLPDVNKACYIAARARATCDLKAFTYVVTPNDHTQGGAAGVPVPELMIAVNDEATGMIVDAISHSPMWPKTLVVITEDDPQNGGDHVDAHRTPLVLVSPWVKRGYVSSTHIDMASLHKLFAHVFAKPYLAETVADAAVPFDFFTSTPDYTPYTYAPHTVESTCNPAGTRQAKIAEGWNLADPDEAPGLAAQVEERMRDLSRR